MIRLLLIMLLTFDTHGNDKQKEACRYWADDSIAEIGYGGSKGSGKSYLGCKLIFSDALTYPGTHYFIARKKLNDLRKHTVPSILEVFEDWGLGPEYYTFNGQDNLFKLYNSSIVYLLEAKYMPSDPLYYRFGSMQMTRGMIEEAGEIDEAARNNLAASIGRWKNEEYKLPGKLLETCNPAKNYLYRKYYKPNKEGTIEPFRRFIQALPEDNKMLDAGYLDNLRRTLSVSEKERLLFGNWEYDDDPAAMIEYDAIVSIFTNDFVRGTGRKYITADVARFGSDKTVIRIWDGLKVIMRVEMIKKSLPEVAAEVRRLATLYTVPMSNVAIDEDGIGAGVVDILRGCRGFVAASSPINPKKGELYENLKAQCAFLLAEKINANMISEPGLDEALRDQLVEELEQIKQKNVDKDGRKGIVPKEKVKALLNRSPDDADTYIMRMLFEVAPSGKLRVI
jgi:phage terminase large subunit